MDYRYAFTTVEYCGSGTSQLAGRPLICSLIGTAPITIAYNTCLLSCGLSKLDLSLLASNIKGLG